MVTKNLIAIIPARGGSKRIPQKNIIDFFDKPLIAWTIEAARHANIFDMIFVSTDDEKIAIVAQNYGAEVPFLRDNYFDDQSTCSQVVVHALETIQKKLDLQFENVCLLMPNCPLRNDKDIQDAYANFIKEKFSFQISCFKFGWMNPWWAFKQTSSAHEFIFPQNIKQRSQDLESLYCPTGAIWLAKTKALFEEKTFYGTSLHFFPLDWKNAIDIDNYEDLEMAKALYLMQKSQ